MEITNTTQDTTKSTKKKKKQVQVVTESNTNETTAEDKTTPDENEPHPDTPTPIDIKKECRYSVTINLPPSTDPWKLLAELLHKFLKHIHEQASNLIYIATWDKEMADSEKVIKKPKDFPEGLPKNRKHYGNYFGGYTNPRKGKASSHLKGHFFGVWSNSVVRGTGFLQFGLTIRHF
jgi:hypothetical protein